MNMPGYIKLHRSIFNSSVMDKPPHTREVWLYLLLSANHADNHICKRGQCVRTIKNIQEELAWYAGSRKIKYMTHLLENSMKALRNAGMIATKKTTRGALITICNYEEYQGSFAKGGRAESRADCRIDSWTTAEPLPNYKQECNKNVKKKEEQYSSTSVSPACVINLFNTERKKTLPRSRNVALSNKRSRSIKKMSSFLSDETSWIEYFKKVADSPFLTGDNDKGWRADFDWLINQNNYLKVVEGKYDKRDREKKYDF